MDIHLCMTHKVNLTVTDRTMEWLRSAYPEATSEAEAVRMAILVARATDKAEKVEFRTGLDGGQEIEDDEG